MEMNQITDVLEVLPAVLLTKEGIEISSDSEYISDEETEDITEEEYQDIVEEMFYFTNDAIDQNIIQYANPQFKTKIVNMCSSHFHSIGEIQGWFQDEDINIMDHLIDHTYETIINNIVDMPNRQVLNPVIPVENKMDIDKILQKTNACPIQKQRSPEWYDIRKKCFSASNMWKLFGSSSQYNSLIYEKCKTSDIRKQDYNGVTNSNTPLNWGIKYEPISVMIYETMFQTKVNTNYGCIPHDTLPIGASPDGIVNDNKSSQYGHMVEIKNIFNREITGIPSEEYWIQMQIQLETTGLRYCDFLETRFKEFPDVESYKSSEHKFKGIILFFIPLENVSDESKFVYKPLVVEEDQSWIETQCTTLEQSHVLYETIYWYMDEVSCVLVERNQQWFSRATPIIVDAWKIVEKERKEGFEHRAPQKRKPKFEESVISSGSLQTHEPQESEHGVKNIKIVPSTVCLIKLDENGNVIKSSL